MVRRHGTLTQRHSPLKVTQRDRIFHQKAVRTAHAEVDLGGEDRCNVAGAADFTTTTPVVSVQIAQ